jgi:hypothetical protein
LLPLDVSSPSILAALLHAAVSPERASADADFSPASQEEFAAAAAHAFRRRRRVRCLRCRCRLPASAAAIMPQITRLSPAITDCEVFFHFSSDEVACLY